MQPSGGGGGGELSRGLARFRSAPATWLEALLESEEEEEEDPVKPNQCLNQVPPTEQLSAAAPTTTTRNSSVTYISSSPDPGFLRQNSSPAEFLSQITSESDGYLSNCGIPPTNNYDSKRPTEKGEQSGHLHGGMGGLLDAEMEKLLEDSIPCRIRAKRGCATHPRSIAERVRRTRISDRIRKLQELVPNMDKQTNTADMLEEAVEYVKFLQRQIQELMEHQKQCKCLIKD